jgi:hypothetical protein
MTKHREAVSQERIVGNSSLKELLLHKRLAKTMRLAIEREPSSADRVAHEAAEAVDGEWLAEVRVDYGDVRARRCVQSLSSRSRPGRLSRPLAPLIPASS